MTIAASDVGSLSRSLMRWEGAEYVFAALVALACFGEYIASFTNLLSEEKSRRDLEKKATLLLIVALALELVCLIQTNSLSAQVIGSIDERAEHASDTAGLALKDSKRAGDQAALAKEDASTAEIDAGTAAGRSRDANALALNADTRASAALSKARDLLTFLTSRSLTQKEMEDLRDAFKPLADPTVQIVVIGSEGSGLSIQVWNSLKEAGFTQAQLQEFPIVPYGMGMSTPRKYLGLAGKIGGILLHTGIGPMMGAPQIARDTDPIRIVVGDIRTAPLPPLHGKHSK